MAMYIITLKLNSTFGTIGKATGVKMTGKAAGKKKKKRNFCVSVKNNLNKYCHGAKHVCKILKIF